MTIHTPENAPDYAASRAFLMQPGPLSVADIQHHSAILAHSKCPADRLIGRTLTCPTAAQLLTTPRVIY